MERFNPLNDYLFLKLMGEKGDEEQCLAFLNAVLGSKSLKPVTLVKILENKTFVAEVIGDSLYQHGKVPEAKNRRYCKQPS